jgi:hypothetical protein
LALGIVKKGREELFVVPIPILQLLLFFLHFALDV